MKKPREYPEQPTYTDGGEAEIWAFCKKLDLEKSAAKKEAHALEKIKNAKVTALAKFERDEAQAARGLENYKVKLNRRYNADLKAFEDRACDRAEEREALALNKIKKAKVTALNKLKGN